MNWFSLTKPKQNPNYRWNNLLSSLDVWNCAYVESKHICFVNPNQCGTEHTCWSQSKSSPPCPWINMQISINRVRFPSQHNWIMGTSHKSQRQIGDAHQWSQGTKIYSFETLSSGNYNKQIYSVQNEISFHLRIWHTTNMDYAQLEVNVVEHWGKPEDDQVTLTHYTLD